jgi:glycosyltransferase involved in cell wall biosynthesis
MTIVNYIIDEGLVNRLTVNCKWIDSYIPSVVGHVKEHGIDVVIDRNSDFDVMHIHVPMFLAYRLSMNKNNGDNKPSIFHGHMTEDTFFVGRKVKYFTRWWFKSIAQKSDVILCPSVPAAEYYHYILPNIDIKQLNYGIDLDRYAYSHLDRFAFRQHYGIEAGKTVVSCVCGVVQRKGYEMISPEDNMGNIKAPGSVLFTGYTLNVDEFAAHINSLADDQGLAARIGREACLSARRHHDIDLVCASLAEIYRELAG